MTSTSLPLSEPSSPHQRVSLAGFFGLAFCLSWVGAAPSIVGSWVGPESVPGIVKPLQILMLIGPALAAFIAAGLNEGKPGVFRLFRRLIHWRVSAVWYGLVLAGPAILFGLASWGSVQVGLSEAAFPGLGDLPARFLPIFLVYMVLNTEELAWRGYALPKLQARLSPLLASLVLGGIWAVFHLPLFLRKGGHMAGYPFWILIVIAMSLTLLLSFLFNRTGGSVLLVHLLHQSINAWGEAFPTFPLVTKSMVPMFVILGAIVLLALAVVLLTKGQLGYRASVVATAEE